MYNGNAAGSNFWKVPPAAPPTAAQLFNGAIYARGGATLAALRIILDDTEFFRIMRTWATDNKYGIVTTPQFIELVKTITPNPTPAWTSSSKTGSTTRISRRSRR